MGKPLTVVYLVALLVLTVSAAAEEGNDSGCSAAAAVNSEKDLKYKIVAIFSTLIFGVFGVCLPIFGLDGDGFFYACVRQFGAYVMGLASVIYILPDATASLTSSCIGDFPMTGVVVARAAAILTMIESKSFASAFMNISHSENHNGDDDHVDNSASQRHTVSRQDHNKIRQKLVTQVLELGFVVHSVIIGIVLGASPNLSTIKPLIPAIAFHQLFQGISLGGCISEVILLCFNLSNVIMMFLYLFFFCLCVQAKFELKKTLTMVIVFSLTAPVGIGIGIGIAEIYYKNGQTTMIVSGFLHAAAAGMLLFMAGVTGYNLKPHSTLHMLKALGFVLLVLM
ncbi:probable zinc transporter 12 isoform X1 [Brassica rapa]|uniref:probable zinc transporter 12 isoform X1 n=1 Tax=Brassica campestris TaxID=3711 RepID=UPI00142DC014|nr:probable zinc transporter 12 isoform X1 [Brassica rapa]